MNILDIYLPISTPVMTHTPIPSQVFYKKNIFYTLIIIIIINKERRIK